MTTVMVRYTVRPGEVQRNEELVRAVFAELARTEPAGLRYATFRLDDGRSFVHLASVEPGAERHPLTSLEAFARFQEGIAERCEVAPVVTALDAVGDFRLLGAPAVPAR